VQLYNVYSKTALVIYFTHVTSYPGSALLKTTYMGH